MKRFGRWLKWGLLALVGFDAEARFAEAFWLRAADRGVSLGEVPRPERERAGADVRDAMLAP